MIVASPELINKLKAGSSLEIVIKIDLLTKDETFIEEITPFVIDGSLNIDKNNDIKRNFSLTLDNINNNYTPGLFNKIWLDKKIKIYYGVQLLGGIEYIPQGVFRLTKFSASTGVSQSPQVRIEGMDKASGWGKTVNNLTIDAGTNVSLAIQLVLDGLETKFNFDDCSETIPYSLNYNIGTERIKIVKELVDMITWDIGYNIYGELRFKPHVNPDNSVITWTYQKDDYTLYAGSDKSIDDAELFNHILTIGSSTQSATVSAEATDEDLMSPFSIPNIGDRLYIHNNGTPDPLITTVVLAQARSDYELRRKLQIVERQTIKLAPNFLHEEGDVIQLIDDGHQTNDKYEILKFNLPLTTNGTMNAECWRVRNLL